MYSHLNQGAATLGAFSPSEESSPITEFEFVAKGSNDEARSHFTFEMIHWICGITEILLAVSSVPACDDRSQKKIREHARWLISTLTWIPDDEETVTFVENFQMTETLFRAAMDARARSCNKMANEIATILLSWTFKGGRFQTGWGVLRMSTGSTSLLQCDPCWNRQLARRHGSKTRTWRSSFEERRLAV